MITLVGIGGTINAIVALFIAFQLFSTYRTSSNLSHWHFLMFYFLFGIFHLFFATSQIFLVNGSAILVAFFHAISYFFLLVSLGYIITFPHQLTGRGIPAHNALIAFFVLSVLYTAIRLALLEPSVREMVGAFVYWRPVFPESMRVLIGVIAVTAAGYVAGFFFRFGASHRSNAFLFSRSLWIGSGTAVLVLAALLGLVVAPTGSPIFVFLATGAVLCGLLITLRGIYYPNNSE